MPEDTETKRRLVHYDNKITLGEIILIIPLAVGVIIFGVHLEDRQDQLSFQQAQQIVINEQVNQSLNTLHDTQFADEKSQAVFAEMVKSRMNMKQ